MSEELRQCPPLSANAAPKEEVQKQKMKAAKSEFQEDFNEFSSVKRVIGVVSGKGGVGKSSVTASIAAALAADGLSVGIMDADITGPSIPKMFGIEGQLTGGEDGVEAAADPNGIKVVSMNLLLEDEEAPVIWRGPVIAGVVKQFWTDIIWGDLDVMLVDMPPGTGDVPLTVFQSLPVDGIVVVTSPQELVEMIVKKAINMAAAMDVPVLGVVENYSYFTCPDCGKNHYIYGESRIDETSGKLGVPVLGKLPINPEFAKACDAGQAGFTIRTELQPAVDAIKALL